MKNYCKIFITKHLEGLVFLILFLFPLIFWFFDGNIIFGHDGSVMLDSCSELSKDYYSLWTNYFNGTLLSHQGFIIIAGILYLSHLIGIAFFARAALFSLIFVLPVASMFYFLRALLSNKDKHKIYIIIASLFYGLNFFVVQRWHEVQWVYLISYGLLPLLLLFIYNYTKTNNFKYAFYGFILILFNSINISDPPIIIGYWGLALLFFIIIVLVKKDIKPVLILKRLILFFLISFLSVLFVLIPLFYVIQGVKMQEFADNNIGLNYVNLTMQQDGLLGLIRQMGYFLLYTPRFTGEYFYDFIGIYLNNFFVIFSIFFITIISLCGVFAKKNNYLGSFSSLLIIFGLLFANGIQKPTGEIFKWLFLNIPFFWMFRSPDNKFFPLYIFGIAIGIGLFFVYVKINDIFKKFVALLIFTAIMIYAFPIVTNIVPQKQHRIKTPDEYQEIAQMINQKKIEFNVALGNRNSFGDFVWESDKKFSGTNLLLLLLSKGIVWNPTDTYAYKNNSIIYKKAIYNNDLDIDIDLLRLVNIRYLILNKDLDYNQLTKNTNEVYKEKTLVDYQRAFSQFSVVAENNNLVVYSVGQDNNGIFYVPGQIIITTDTLDSLTDIVSALNYQSNSAIYFQDQNKSNEMISELKKINKDSDENTFPILEFKKINPIKYKIRVHGAKDDFPLVFSESFHSGWKVYPVKSGNAGILQGTELFNRAGNYKILDGNDEDQASSEELSDYISKGWVTDLGNGNEKKIEHKKWEDGKEKLDYVEKYNIDFVSKNFQDTIQNDNLPKGSIFETWFKKPLPEENHLTANGYANSWWIDLEEVCQVESYKVESGEGSFCIKNPDGSYDFEMVVEFWPQRLFYVGLGISGITLLGCIIYLAHDYKKRKFKIETSNNDINLEK
ncbi:hypothetical protein KJ671_03015 [Patescibacteria group bacterium]|nr:hypothetical protein [Patescibacteria group bacterium]